MDKKIVLGSRKQNISIIIGAACLAVGLFYIVKNPEFFAASVLSLQEKTFIVDKWRDIAYKSNSWYVDIFMSEKLETPANIDFTISFDKDSIFINAQNISGQGTRTTNFPDENSIIIHSIPNQNIDKSQSIVMLPFTGNNENILLSEAVAQLSDGTEKSLSIGSLNEVNSHSK